MGTHIYVRLFEPCEPAGLHRPTAVQTTLTAGHWSKPQPTRTACLRLLRQPATIVTVLAQPRSLKALAVLSQLHCSLRQQIQCSLRWT